VASLESERQKARNRYSHDYKDNDQYGYFGGLRLKHELILSLGCVCFRLPIVNQRDDSFKAPNVVG
jgi:hypothetical protein